MVMPHSAFGIAAAIVVIVSFIPYIRSILRGHTKPNRVTTFIWASTSLLTVSSYIASGAHTAIFCGLAYTILEVVVFLLSIKRGMGGLKPIDLLALSGAAIGCVLWVTTKDPLLALYIGVFIEFIAYLPVFEKSYKHPHTENTLSWELEVAASLLNLLALSTIDLNESLYPISAAIGNTVVMLILVKFNKKHRSISQKLKSSAIK